MTQPTNLRRLKAAGFSMVELLIVLAIMMVVAAIAVPSMTGAIDNIRMRSAVTELIGLLQQARITAVQGNLISITKLASATGMNQAYVDMNYNTTVDTYPCLQNPALTCTEPQVAVNSKVNVMSSGVPTSFPSTTLLGYNQAASSTPFAVAFNQRGLPCTPNTTSARPSSCTNTGYLYYFKMDATFGAKWMCITITPAGRIRSWVLTGTSWN